VYIIKEFGTRNFVGRFSVNLTTTEVTLLLINLRGYVCLSCAMSEKCYSENSSFLNLGKLTLFLSYMYILCILLQQRKINNTSITLCFLHDHLVSFDKLPRSISLPNECVYFFDNVLLLFYGTNWNWKKKTIIIARWRRHCVAAVARFLFPIILI